MTGYKCDEWGKGEIESKGCPSGARHAPGTPRIQFFPEQHLVAVHRISHRPSLNRLLGDHTYALTVAPESRSPRSA